MFGAGVGGSFRQGPMFFYLKSNRSGRTGKFPFRPFFMEKIQKSLLFLCQGCIFQEIFLVMSKNLWNFDMLIYDNSYCSIQDISYAVCFFHTASNALLQSADAVCGEVELCAEHGAGSVFAESCAGTGCTTVLDCSGAETRRRDCTQCAAARLIFTKKTRL